jgi:hypothetical protein
MIYFNKLTDYQSEILSDGKIIGTLEKLANEYYIIEIDYFEFPVKIENKRLIKGLIEKVYSKVRARDLRSMKKLRPYAQFKTLS